MRAAVVAAALIGGLVAPLLAQADIVRTIERLEDELNTAFNAYDASTLDRLWGEELVFISPNGAVASKAQRLAGLKNRPASVPVSSNDSIDVKVYGDTAVAIVVSSWTGVPNATKPIRFRATHVWNQRGGGWKLVAAHVTQLANP